MRAEKTEAVVLRDDGAIPNNPDLALIVHRGAVEGEADMAAAFERLFARNGWGGGWRDSIFPYHHYHSTAHEALGIAAGHATVQFGGDGGVTVEVRAGDAVVIPAGVGHKNLGSSADFLVVGAYPTGQRADMNTGRPEERARALEAIRRVPLPAMDPVYGPDGPLVERWGRR